MWGMPQSIHVLHVDDEPGIVDLTATCLERENDRIDVRTANNPDDALAIVADDDVGIDCIVSDYEMPGRNGIELLKAVRETHPKLPFVLYTGKGSEEVASEAISAGVTDYLQKETGTDQYTVLANRIKNVVAQHRAEKLVNRAFQAMDRSREGIALLDESGEFIYVNDVYAEIVGYDPDALIGEFWEVVYPDDQADRIYEEILSSVPEEGHWSGDTVYQHKDGSRIRVDHALTYSEEGTMICLIRSMDDADVRGERLFKERQRFGLFVDAVEDYAIFMLDPEGYVITWNTGAEQIKGYAEDEILGKHFSTFYTEKQRAEGLPDRLLDRALEDGAVESEGPRVRKDGSTFRANVVITAVHDEDGAHRGFGKVTRDLTDTVAGDE
jgi:PAS domain S-box-containing protein